MKGEIESYQRTRQKEIYTIVTKTFKNSLYGRQGHTFSSTNFRQTGLHILYGIF